MIPIGPNFLASDITMPEKKSQKTNSMPAYNTPVAQAAGNSFRQEILRFPPNRGGLLMLPPV